MTITQRRVAALVGSALAVGLLVAHSAMSTHADSGVRVVLSYGRASDGEAPASARAALLEHLLRHTPAPSATPTTPADTSATPTTPADTPVPPTLTATAIPPSATPDPPHHWRHPPPTPTATSIPPTPTATSNSAIPIQTNVAIAMASAVPTATPIPPTNTPTSTPLPPTPTSTSTPLPPTPTPTPTDTDTPAATSNPSGAAAMRPGASVAARVARGTYVGPPRQGPVRKRIPKAAVGLRVTVRPALVQPGAVARVAVSYVEDALVKVIVYFPQQRPFWLYDSTDSHGHATLAIHVPRHVLLAHGRAVASIFVRAVVGPWRNLARLAPVVHPGTTARISVSYIPLTLVRALVTLPGMPPLRLFDVTDGRGHLRLSIMVPRHLHSNQGPAVAQVAVAALATRRTAVAASTLNISDMVVSVSGTPIVDCMQTQMVHVAYRPNTQVRILLLFPHQYHLTLTARTDRQGTAAVNVQVAYRKAPNPLRIGVEVSAASGRAPRIERIVLAVRLPRACRA